MFPRRGRPTERVPKRLGLFAALAWVACGGPSAQQDELSRRRPTPDSAVSTSPDRPTLPPTVWDPTTLPTGSSGPDHNVLIVLLDDVGVDQLQAYGQPVATAYTPELDDFATTAMRFEHAYAHPTCTPSRASLLTGQYAMRHGLGKWIAPSSDPASLDPDAVILPEVVRLAEHKRWSDAAIGKWHLVSFIGDSNPATHPLRTGFSAHVGALANPNNAMTEPGDHDYFRWEKNRNGVLSFSETYMTTDTTDEAILHMETLEEPWLLYVAYNAVHVPLHEPPRELYHQLMPDEPGERDFYVAMVEALDTEVGRLLQASTELVDGELTTIVLGDNGSPRHAILPPLNAQRNKGTVFEGGVRVPLMVSGPLVAEPGSHSFAPVHIVDILPTVAEIAEVGLGSLTEVDGQPLELDGMSLVPLLQDPSLTPERLLYSARTSPNGPGPWRSFEQTIRNATHKVVRFGDGREGLFVLNPTLNEGEELGPHQRTGADDQALEVLSAAIDEVASTFDTGP
jgi:arylsulfatase A-like enzyme